MPQIHIPAMMRPKANDQAIVEVDGQTVGEALARLTEQFPDLSGSLWDDSRHVHAFVNIFVDGHNIRDRDQLNTAVGQRQVVLIVPALAGG
ncbi:MAG: MoaD/ThiS family protein [Pirellulaceae bacterium]|nr:MoaD/ThiS family protein [Pirellulaceae bacterium]